MRNNLDCRIDELCDYIVSIKNKEDCKALLDDLCTNKEVEQMALRAYAAKLFMNGATYVEVIKETGLSSTTLSRITRCLTYGNGGYRIAIGQATNSGGKGDDETE